MADIIQFDPDRNKPHSSGPAVCLACHHEWISVAPAGSDLSGLECPSCHLHRGKRAGLCIPGEPRWICNCGNDLFLVTVASVFCPNCATIQTFS